MLSLEDVYSEVAVSKNRSLVADSSDIYKDLIARYRANGSPLEVDFRTLVDWVKLGDQFTHQIHPYPAKLIPHIANFFVNVSTFFGREKAVLDPFCGSGTVALEASLAGCVPYVSDSNPLALLITKVKTTNYDVQELSEELKAITFRCKRYRSAPQIAIVNSNLWYSAERKKALEIILRAVGEIEDDDTRDFFRVCFSVTAKRFSNADPAISVPVRLKTRDRFSEATNNKIIAKLKWLEESSPLQEFIKVSLANIDRVASANRHNIDRLPASVISKDARRLACHHTYVLKSLSC